MLDCHFVGREKKPEKFSRSSSLSRPVDTARDLGMGSVQTGLLFRQTLRLAPRVLFLCARCHPGRVASGGRLEMCRPVDSPTSCLRGRCGKDNASKDLAFSTQEQARDRREYPYIRTDLPACHSCCSRHRPLSRNPCGSRSEGVHAELFRLMLADLRSKLRAGATQQDDIFLQLANAMDDIGDSVADLIEEAGTAGRDGKQARI